MPVLLHGDAAFIGQGLRRRDLNLSELAGYRTGGTDPRRRQQPDRLHHLAPRVPLDPVRTDIARMMAHPDLPRQRRGP
jgi:hypothetical protein